MDYKRDYRSYEVIQLTNNTHIDTGGCGKETLSKAAKTSFNCHWTPLLVLTDIFKSLNTEMTGELEKPWEEARRRVINGEQWTRDELTRVFDLKKAKEASRKVKRRLGLTDKFIVPQSCHHLAGGEQIHFPIMETNADGIMVENRNNLFFCMIDYLQLLLMSTNLVMDNTYRNLRGSSYYQTLNLSCRATINGINRYVTVFSIIMCNKTATNYRTVFKEIATNPQFLAGRPLQNLQTITTDFELSITNSFLQVFNVSSNCQIFYCAVHYSRNILAKARKKGIVSEFTKSNGLFSEFWRDIEQVS